MLLLLSLLALLLALEADAASDGSAFCSAAHASEPLAKVTSLGRAAGQHVTPNHPSRQGSPESQRSLRSHESPPSAA